MVNFSVIIPTYNSLVDIDRCLQSLLLQDFEKSKFEILIVDDCSTDGTEQLVSKHMLSHENIMLYKTIENSGPGIARNIGIENAKGNWLIFLDSDDTLVDQSLIKIEKFIEAHDSKLDALGINWRYDTDSGNAEIHHHSGRTDGSLLEGPKEELIREYLSLRMDGSTIFTVIKKDFLDSHAIRFEAGYHEDVDFIFKVYWHAKTLKFFNEIIYKKANRKGSIVNTLTPQHIDGFFRAWDSISKVIGDETEYNKFYIKGMIGVVATRLREAYRKERDSSKMEELLNLIYEYSLPRIDLSKISSSNFETKYEKTVVFFMQAMKPSPKSKINNLRAILDELRSFEAMSWSCTDLHHSIFFAPDQVRTCCKRFFKDGEMRGDVSLIDLPEKYSKPISSQDILTAKIDLHRNINAGKETPCDGCPFLEFREWNPLDKLEIKYLSLEYHSVCNLKCTYCDDVYYGGKQPNYDVKSTFNNLMNEGSLDKCTTIVWGGGEPVLGKHFDELLENSVDKLSGAKQRILTNSVKYNQTVEKFLNSNLITITTSIDAGTEDTFKNIRGRSSLLKVINNLKIYATERPENVTIKYIFTTDNSSIAETKEFLRLIDEHELLSCNFQISYDFKSENIPIETLVSMIFLYGQLVDKNCRLVFFDDLLWHRLSNINSESEKEIKRSLKDLGLENAIADKNAFESVAIWGNGKQAEYVLEKSSFFRKVRVECFVDSRESKIGEEFMGKIIQNPEILTKGELPIVIIAVQGFSTIYNMMIKMGINPSRLVKGLII